MSTTASAVMQMLGLWVVASVAMAAVVGRCTRGVQRTVPARTQALGVVEHRCECLWCLRTQG